MAHTWVARVPALLPDRSLVTSKSIQPTSTQPLDQIKLNRQMFIQLVVERQGDRERQSQIPTLKGLQRLTERHQARWHSQSMSLSSNTRSYMIQRPYAALSQPIIRTGNRIEHCTLNSPTKLVEKEELIEPGFWKEWEGVKGRAFQKLVTVRKVITKTEKWKFIE